MSRPDALMVPESIKRGKTQLDRIDSVLSVVEPLLQVKRPGERAYIRRQPGGMQFISRNPRDTLYHANGTDLEGKPRYQWEDADVPGVTGIQVGYLIDYNPAPEPAPLPAPEPAPAPAEPPAEEPKS